MLDAVNLLCPVESSSLRDLAPTSPTFTPVGVAMQGNFCGFWAENLPVLRSRRVLKGLDDDALAIFAKGAAEGIRNFADCGEGFDSLNDGWHQVFGGAGAALDFG